MVSWAWEASAAARSLSSQRPRPGCGKKSNSASQGISWRTYGAPDLDAALPAAREEVDFIAELCRDAPINTVFIVRRAFDSAGRIKEDFAPSRLRRADLGMPASGWWSPIEALCLKEKVMGAR